MSLVIRLIQVLTNKLISF